MSVGACLLGAPAATADTASEGLTVTAPQVRSVTVSPGSVSCAPALTFPNGSCSTSLITVTVGPVAGHVMVNGADAVPSTGTPNWTLCGASCTGSTGMTPGVDGFSNTLADLGSSMFQGLGNLPNGDFHFGSASGAATPGQVVQEISQVVGPSSSTNTSSAFSTSITWTAAP